MSYNYFVKSSLDKVFILNSRKSLVYFYSNLMCWLDNFMKRILKYPTFRYQ